MGTAKNEAFQQECQVALSSLLLFGAVQRHPDRMQWRRKMPEVIWVLSWDNVQLAFFSREDATGYACKVHGPIDSSDSDEFEAGRVRCKVREVGCFTYNGSLTLRASE